MTDVVDLAVQIGTWADRNFNTHANPQLHQLLPLLGIVEELGECETGDKDGIADAAIYALDLIYRLCHGYKDEINSMLTMISTITRSDVVALDPSYATRPESGLARAFLKRIQGIRGFDQDKKFKGVVTICLAGLFQMLQDRMGEADLWDFTAETFNRIVSRRNWQLNPQSGTVMG